MKKFTRKEAIDCLSFSVLESTEKVKLPVVLWGVHGIGKTEIVKQVASQLPWTDKNGNEQTGWNLVIKHLSLDDTVDLLGMPYNENGIQKWTCPAWLEAARKVFEETGQPSLFFLDEFNRGQRIVLQGMLPFLIEGRLGEHRIGPKDAVVCACNPATDAYETNDLFDEALLDRLGHILFKPTNSEFLEWADDKLSNVTLNVLKNNSKFMKVEDTEIDVEVSPSRRSIYNILSVLEGKDEKWILDKGHHVLECYLGKEFADEWMVEYSNNSTCFTLNTIYSDDQNTIRNILLVSDMDTEFVRLDLFDKACNLILNDPDLKNNFDKIIRFFEWDKIPKDALSAFFEKPEIKHEYIVKDLTTSKKIAEFMKRKRLFETENIKLGAFA